MGAKNPDRVRMPPSPTEALTVAEIYVAGWELRGSCNRCGLALRGNAATLTRALGPDFVLWGYQSRCPRFDPCGGAFAYSARSTGGGSWVTLRQPAPPNVIELWRTKRVAWHKPPR